MRALTRDADTGRLGAKKTCYSGVKADRVIGQTISCDACGPCVRVVEPWSDGIGSRQKG